jgi:hypothetical protein
MTFGLSFGPEKRNSIDGHFRSLRRPNTAPRPIASTLIASVTDVSTQVVLSYNLRHAPFD